VCVCVGGGLNRNQTRDGETEEERGKEFIRWTFIFKEMTDSSILESEGSSPPLPNPSNVRLPEPVHRPTAYFSKIQFNIIFPFASLSSRKFLHQGSARISCYMSSPY